MENTTEAMNITLKGLQLYSKVQSGETKLNISRIVIGDGYLSENETAMYIAALKHEVDTTATIISNEIIGDGTTCITIRLNETAEAFYLREIGVMANDPDEGEILYAYCNYGKYADYIKYYGAASAEVQEISIYTQVGNASSINIDVKNATAVTQYELEQHTQNKANPHNVTATQVGLGNVINEKQATKEEFDTHAGNKANPHNVTAAQVGLGNVTNEKQATKEEFDTHAGSKANPHNVTAAQVGLGNVTNESKATMFESPLFTGRPCITNNYNVSFVLDHNWSKTDANTITHTVDAQNVKVNGVIYEAMNTSFEFLYSTTEQPTQWAIYMVIDPQSKTYQFKAYRGKSISAKHTVENGLIIITIFCHYDASNSTYTASGTKSMNFSVSKDIITNCMPVGAVIPFAGDICPAGWLWCDGSEIPVTEYTNLFHTIYHAYDDGSTATESQSALSNYDDDSLLGEVVGMFTLPNYNSGDMKYIIKY